MFLTREETPQTIATDTIGLLISYSGVSAQHRKGDVETIQFSGLSITLAE